MARSLLAVWSGLAELPLAVEAVQLDRLSFEVSSQFTRVTTVIRLQGAGKEGEGEDVTYQPEVHDSFPELPLGAQSLGSFCSGLAELEDYRRWGVESAALDLALRQAGRSLAQVVEREPQAVSFVVSTALGKPPSFDRLRRLVELYPWLNFKVDSSPAWTEELVTELAAMEAVDVVDFKGQYGASFGDPADPVLYRRVAEGLPGVWLEDPDLAPEADRVLEPHRERITWDAPIHSVVDVESLPFAPRMLNCKPSRFGSVRALFEFYDYCSERGIRLYGGGQFELGPGRGQIQYLASLFHPDAPNDVAPGAFNEQQPRPGLPESPLKPAAAPTGFRWG